MNPAPRPTLPTFPAQLLTGLAAASGTVAFRLAAVIVAAIMVASAIAMVVMFWLSSATVSRGLVDLLAAEAAEVKAIASSAEASQVRTLIAERGRLDPSRLYILVNPQRARLAGNLPQWPPTLAAHAPGGTFHYTVEGADEPRFAAGVVVALPDGNVLLVARDLADQQALAARARAVLLIGLGLLSLSGLTAGLAMSRLVLRRIEAMSATAERIVAGDLSGRAPVSPRGDELDRLARHLNAMLDRIEQLMAGLREVSDNIAHDLKTPLARLRQQAEVSLRDPAAHRTGLEKVIEEADALIATFNALLQIARLEAGAIESAAEAFDLGALVGDVAEFYQPVAEESGLVLEARIEPGLVVCANRQLVSQAVANLIDNAIKYGRPGDGASRPAAVEVRAERVDGRARVTVADHGPGIPAADRERVLGRFVRLDASRTAPGTGLGLSLVAAVSRLIGARLVLEDNTPGLRVSLELAQHAAPRLPE